MVLRHLLGPLQRQMRPSMVRNLGCISLKAHLRLIKRSILGCRVSLRDWLRLIERLTILRDVPLQRRWLDLIRRLNMQCVSLQTWLHLMKRLTIIGRVLLWA